VFHVVTSLDSNRLMIPPVQIGRILPIEAAEIL
jgi:hypothetical protein